MSASGASRMPASAASEQPSRPREARQPRRPRARERRELAVVDDRAHRDAEPRAEQQDPQPDREQRPRVTIVMNAVPREHDVADVEALARRTAAAACGPGSGPRSCSASPMSANIIPTVTISCTTSGLPCRWRMITRSSATPNSGAITSTTSGRRDPRRPAPAVGRVGHLPVHVRHEHADRALGEVEDARRRVDDDEAAGRHRVDAGERQREHHEVRAGSSQLTGLPGPRLHAHGRRSNTIVAAQTSRFDHRWVTRRVLSLRSTCTSPCIPSPGRS